MTDVEQRVREALAAQAATVVEHEYAPAEFAQRLTQRPARRHALRIGAVLAGVAVIVIAIVIGRLVSRPSSAPPADRPSLRPADVLARVRLDFAPQRITVGQGAAWAVAADGRLERYDPVTETITARLRIPGWSASARIAAGLGSLWVATDDEIRQLDPVTGALRHRISTASGSLAVGVHEVWARTGTSTLGRLDLDSGRVVRTLRLPSDPSDLVADGSLLWGVAGPDLLRIDTASGTTRVIGTGGTIRSLAVSATGVWTLGRTLDEYDRSGRRLARVGSSRGLALGADHIAARLYLLTTDGGLSAIQTNASGGPPTGIGAAPFAGPVVALGSVWVSTGPELLRLRQTGL